MLCSRKYLISFVELLAKLKSPELRAAGELSDRYHK